MRILRHVTALAAMACLLVPPPCLAAPPMDPLKAGADRLELAIRIALADQAQTEWKLAVFDFENLSESARDTNLGRTLAGLLTSKLVHTTGITLVEREALERIVREQELSLAGLKTPGTAKRIGKLLNIDAMIVGDISGIQNDFYVNLRMVDTVRGTVLTASSTRIRMPASPSSTNAAQKRAETITQIRKDIDAMTQAIQLYSNIESPKVLKVLWPATLTDLVPDYLDRIPPPPMGRWIYAATTGRVQNSAHPDIRSSITYPKLGPVFKQIRTATTRSHMQRIRMWIANYMAEMGNWPSNLEELSSTFQVQLPDASPGQWVYNARTGEIAYRE